jgi:Leucine-rich repeat (LRR) protein
MAEVSRVGNSGNNLTEVSGSHMTERTNSDVEMLSIYNQPNVTQMPKNIEVFFKNLIGIDVWRTQIASISSDDFKAFPNLKFLDFQGTLLTSLDGNLLENNHKLWWIGFSDNLIKNVGHDLLSGLDELVTVHFNRNPCMDFEASDSSALSELKSLLLSSCPPMVSTQAPTNDDHRAITHNTKFLRMFIGLFGKN